jgi:hypothetical protein
MLESRQVFQVLAMIETLTVLVGMCVTLYLCFWLFETITGRWQRRQDARSISVDLGEAVANAPLLVSECNTPIIDCSLEAGLCAETAEAIGAVGEGIQCVFEAAGEGLSQAISGF